MKQIHFWVSGFVQGVGYRMFIRKEARKRALTGWVKNLPDGQVEAVAQGSEEELKDLLQICEKGSYFAQVRSIVVEWEVPTKEFQEFIILR